VLLTARGQGPRGVGRQARRGAPVQVEHLHRRRPVDAVHEDRPLAATDEIHRRLALEAGVAALREQPHLGRGRRQALGRKGSRLDVGPSRPPQVLADDAGRVARDRGARCCPPGNPEHSLADADVVQLVVGEEPAGRRKTMADRVQVQRRERSRGHLRVQRSHHDQRHDGAGRCYPQAQPPPTDHQVERPNHPECGDQLQHDEGRQQVAGELGRRQRRGQQEEQEEHACEDGASLPAEAHQLGHPDADGGQDRQRDLDGEVQEVEVPGQAPRRVGDRVRVDLSGEVRAVVDHRPAAGVVQAVGPGGGRQDRRVGDDERHEGGGIERARGAPRRAGRCRPGPRELPLLGAGREAEQRPQAQVVNHVLRRQHQAKGGAACRVPAARNRSPRRVARAGFLVEPGAEQQEEHQEGVLLPDPVQSRHRHVEGQQQRGPERHERPEEGAREQEERDNRRRPNQRVRQAERCLGRNGVPARPSGQVVPGVGGHGRAEHRELHQHRVLRVGREVASGVGTQRGNLVDLVLAEPAVVESLDAEGRRQQHDRREREHEHPLFGQRPRSAWGKSGGERDLSRRRRDSSADQGTVGRRTGGRNGHRGASNEAKRSRTSSSYWRLG